MVKEELLKQMRAALYDVALPKYFELISDFNEKGKLPFSLDWFSIYDKDSGVHMFPGGVDNKELSDTILKFAEDHQNNLSSSLELTVYPEGFLTYHAGRNQNEIFFCTFHDFLSLRIPIYDILDFSKNILEKLKFYEEKINEMRSITLSMEKFSLSATRSLLTEKTNKNIDSKLIHGIFQSQDATGYEFIEGHYPRIIHKPGYARYLEHRFNSIGGGENEFLMNADGTIMIPRNNYRMTI